MNAITRREPRLDVRSLLASLAFASFLFAAPLPVHAADLTVSGIPNFHQVNEHVFRGGQPESRAWAGLAAIGVNTVIDLRQLSEHSTTREKQEVEAAGM